MCGRRSRSTNLRYDVKRGSYTWKVSDAEREGTVGYLDGHGHELSRRAARAYHLYLGGALEQHGSLSPLRTPYDAEGLSRVDASHDCTPFFVRSRHVPWSICKVVMIANPSVHFEAGPFGTC